ncbi:MAG TPA: hypothetical protein VFW87_20490, partial [Pirellulales bacterium]|nr:hypothetical protein [Pirellulales bacterium]
MFALITGAALTLAAGPIICRIWQALDLLVQVVIIITVAGLCVVAFLAALFFAYRRTVLQINGAQQHGAFGNPANRLRMLTTNAHPFENRGVHPPRVVADGPLAPPIVKLAGNRVAWLPWQVALEGSREPVDAIYTYGHPHVDGAMLDRLPGVRVISNYGVGVDHLVLADAAKRGIPVGNTPGVLDGATADMGFALLLAAARRVVEGDRYARSPEFTVYDPGYMLGREVHSS